MLEPYPFRSEEHIVDRQTNSSKETLFSAFLIWASVALCLAGTATAAPQSFPRVCYLDGETLAQLRAELAKPGHSELRTQLTTSGDKAMKVGPYSVTMKDRVPPSGDKHDFLSMAPYFWPDPRSPNGLPYIRRDGERNPEAAKIPDGDYIIRTFDATYTLSVAYYLTGDEKYADRAALLLRTWFLDPATRMNPNMNHGQYIAGVNTGRGAGLIETRGISKIVDGLVLLAGSKSWTAEDEKGMREWLAAYLEWLQTSKNGRSEAKAPNNHGTWFEQQIATIALFLGKQSFAKDLVQNSATARIAHQIQADGRQPYELQRTRAMHYSSFNLLGLMYLARAGDAAGVDLWNFSTPDGRSMRKALDFLLPYVSGEKKWEYQQINDYDFSVIEPVLLWSALKFNDDNYGNAAVRFASHDVDQIVLRAAWERRIAAKSLRSQPRTKGPLSHPVESDSRSFGIDLLLTK